MATSLREQIVQRVRTEIIAGQHPPGTMYSVPSLAESLGVSTTPVREALLELARNGLIEPVRNRGFKIVDPTLKELRNVFDLREVLEVYAATTAVTLKGFKFDELDHHARDIARAVDEGDVALYLEADRRFHQLLTDAADNPQLTQMVMALRDHMRLYGINSRGGHQRQQESVAEHFTILKLAKAGKVDELVKVLRHHIRSWEPIFLEALSRNSERGISLSHSAR